MNNVHRDITNTFHEANFVLFFFIEIHCNHAQMHWWYQKEGGAGIEKCEENCSYL